MYYKADVSNQCKKVDFLTNAIRTEEPLEKNDKSGFVLPIISRINSKCTKDLNVKMEPYRH